MNQLDNRFYKEKNKGDTNPSPMEVLEILFSLHEQDKNAGEVLQDSEGTVNAFAMPHEWLSAWDKAKEVLIGLKKQNS